MIAPASTNIMVHYSFDFAQQVHYPSSPLQPGPIYFLTPRKAAIFGVCCEAIPRQVNFVIDEASDTGKGANTVVSLLDFFFSHYGLGETTASLHADNCCGQNKNNTMVPHVESAHRSAPIHPLALHDKCVCASVCVCAWDAMHVWMCVCLCMHVCPLCECVRVCACVYMCKGGYASKCVCMLKTLSVCVWVFVYLHVQLVHVWAYVFVRDRLCKQY